MSQLPSAQRPVAAPETSLSRAMAMARELGTLLEQNSSDGQMIESHDAAIDRHRAEAARAQLQHLALAIGPIAAHLDYQPYPGELPAEGDARAELEEAHVLGVLGYQAARQDYKDDGGSVTVYRGSRGPGQLCVVTTSGRMLHVQATLRIRNEQGGWSLPLEMMSEDRAARLPAVPDPGAWDVVRGFFRRAPVVQPMAVAPLAPARHLETILQEVQARVQALYGTARDTSAVQQARMAAAQLPVIGPGSIGRDVSTLTDAELATELRERQARRVAAHGARRRLN